MIRIIPLTLLRLSAYLISMFIMFIILHICAYEASFSDEIYYFSVLSKPFSFPLSIRLFGYIYYPLYKIFNSNMVHLRQCNLLLNYSLGFFCTYQLMSVLSDSCQYLKRIWRVVLALTFSFGFLLPLFPCHFAFLGPSYNTLDFQACIMIVTAVLFIQKQTDSRIKNNLAWIILGINLWLLFMSKPTSLFLMTFSLLIYLQSEKLLNIKGVILTILVSMSLFICTARYLDGSIIKFLHDFMRAIHLHSSFQIYKPLTTLYQSIIASVVFSMLCSKHRSINIIIMLFFVMFLLLMPLFFDVKPMLSGNITRLNGVLLWLLALLMFIAFRCKPSTIDSPKSYLSLFLLSIPFCYAWTSDNYWTHWSSAGIFAIMAMCLVLPKKLSSKQLITVLIAVSLTVQMITLLIFCIDVYSTKINNYSHSIKLNGTPFLVNDEKYKAFLTINSVANKAHFIPGTPIFDFSTQPFNSYALGARQLMEPTINTKMIDYLNDIPCNVLVQAWIITKLPVDDHLNTFLGQFNALIQDYTQITTWKLNISEWGTASTYALLKPNRPFKISLSQCLTRS